MARYLRSLATGVVLPYIENVLKAGGVVELQPNEVEKYEASLPSKKAAPKKAAPKKPAPKKAVVEPAVGEMIVEDFDPATEAVLKAIEDD